MPTSPSVARHCDPCAFGEIPSKDLSQRELEFEAVAALRVARSINRAQQANDESMVIGLPDPDKTPPYAMRRAVAAKACAEAICADKCLLFALAYPKLVEKPPNTSPPRLRIVPDN